MNRLEFYTVIKTFGIKNPISHSRGRYGTSETVYSWNNLKINFGGSYYTVIEGQIPLEVANIIYKKYPNNPYKIRVNGGADDWIPNEQATDDIYEEKIEQYIKQDKNMKEYLENCKKALKNLKRRNDKNKYIKTYHIDTKEGLLIFLTEMEDYILRKQGMEETKVKKYDDLIANINREIIKRVNPSIPIYEWMQGAEENKEIYNKTIERDNKTKLGQLFRTTLENFDKIVNPYLNNEIEFDDINNYSKKVLIYADTYSNENGKHRQNCCFLNFENRDDKHKNTTYYRNPDGFSFQLHYAINENLRLNVMHYFTTPKNNNLDDGEIIVIKYYGTNFGKEITLNLTNYLAGTSEKDKAPVTPEQIGFIYDELLKATEYASSITIDNMKKNKTLKK